MVAEIGSSLIGAGSSLVGGIVGAIQNKKNRQFQEKMQNKQNEFTERMWNQQNEWNLEQWERENEYNSPKAQINRLLDAGINPNSIFSGQNPNVDASSVQADSVGGAPASGNGIASDLSHLGSSMVQNAAMVGNYLMDQKNKMADLKLKQQQSMLLHQQEQSNQIQLMNDAMFSNRERNAALQTQFQNVAESRARENNLIQQLKNSKLDEQEKQIAISFAKQHNEWLLKEDEQTLKNLAMVCKQTAASISDLNASAALKNQQKVNEQKRGDILDQQSEQAKVETDIAKNTQKDREAAIKAGAKNDEEQAIYMEWRNKCLENGVDPDGSAALRLWQETLEDWRKNGGIVGKSASWLFRTIGATVDKASNIVGPLAGAAAGAYFGGKAKVNSMSSPKQTLNPVFQQNSTYQGTYGNAPWQQ